MCRGDANRATWTDVSTRLVQSGIHTLTFDLRGYGESSGGEPPFTTMANFISFWRTTGMNDIDAAYQFLLARPGVNTDAIGLGGASYGVFMGIEAASRYGNIGTLALLSGPFDDEAAAKLSGHRCKTIGPSETSPGLIVENSGKWAGYVGPTRQYINGAVVVRDTFYIEAKNTTITVISSDPTTYLRIPVKIAP